MKEPLVLNEVEKEGLMECIEEMAEALTMFGIKLANAETPTGRQLILTTVAVGELYNRVSQAVLGVAADSGNGDYAQGKAFLLDIMQQAIEGAEKMVPELQQKVAEARASIERDMHTERGGYVN
jgi:hypothetical protein